MIGTFIRNVRGRAFVLGLCGALLAAAAGAQENPNLARGFEAGKQYDVGNVDSVNLFNGGLTLTIPIGGSYAVNGSLSYGLTLVYNSNVWDYDVRYDSLGNGFVQASPRESSNAGLGWALSLGKLYYPAAPGNKSYKWVFLSPDGGQHTFFPTLHEDDPLVAGVCYTRDDSYLRLTGVIDCTTATSSLAAEIEFPDGSIRRFTRPNSASAFRIVQIRDRYNNQVNVDYSIANQWTISDAHRTHRIYFATRASGMTAVDRVELASFNGGVATYTFNYTDTTIARSCKDNDSQTSANVGVSLLKSVSMPEGHSYSMLDAGGVNPAYNTACDVILKDLPGTIQRLTLPTQGVIEWTYRQYKFPDSVATLGPYEDQVRYGTVAGVSTKAVREPSGACYGGAPSCTWTYVPKGSSAEPWERSLTLTSPLGDDTVYYFDENPYKRQFGGWEYSLPMKKSVTDGAGRYLSQEIFDGPAVGGVRKRAVYVRYEHDKLPYPANAENYYNTNRRLASQRIVYDDDPGRYADINYSGFDGLGHYRTAATDGNFGGGDVRTTFAGYNPDAAGTYRVYTIDPTTNAPAAGHNFVMLGTGSPWLIETFVEQTVSEGGATAKTEFCFDAATGFLRRKRTLANGTSRGASDVIAVLTPSSDGRGNLGTEQWFGGDTQAVSTAALCGLALPASDQYRIDYTYQYGGLATAQYWGFSFRSANYVIDASTGLVRTSSDSSGIATQYEYDQLGRLLWEKPAAGHGAWMQNAYTPATAGAYAEVNVYAWPNGTTGSLPALTASRIRLDRLGRPTQESLLMPNGTYSTRETFYNPMGWKTTVSELGNTGAVTTFLNYDPFGRPTTIRPPDGAAHDTTLSYMGVRSVSRTVSVGTAWNGSAVTESAATTTEVYDRQGHLWQVIPPPGGATATYGYNVVGLLASVSLNDGFNAQSRWFNYDNRGFLTSEQIPEKGAFGYGTVSYLGYDARGHSTRRIDGPNGITFVYDRAERLTQIYKTGTPALCSDPSARCLKTFTYADANLPGDWRQGKLVQAQRYNYPVLYGTQYNALVTELFTYGGKGGRVSQKETRLTFNGTTNEYFPQSWTYDDLGQVSALTYPNCAFAACPSTPRTVSFGYGNGWLTSVPGYASSISYHSNGLPSQVVHANGVVFTQNNDLYGIPRPASMTAVKGATTLWTAGTYDYDGAGSPKTIGAQRFLYDLVGRVTEGRTPDGQYQQYAYDAFGNVTSLNTTGSLVNTPTDPGTNRLGWPSSYDAAGNLTSYAGSQYEYDELDMLKHFTSGSEEWLYMYTAEDERFWSFKVGANPRFDRWTLRDLDGRVLRQYDSTNYVWDTFEDFVYRQGKLLSSVYASGVQRHFDVDHLGSVRLVTDAAGNSLGFHRFFPYGKENTALQEGERLKFAGHERDLGNLAGDGDDLDYMHARYYSPLNGRFLSMDPVGGDPREPQSWNRYAYVLGNPMRYVDPRGLLPDDPNSIDDPDPVAAFSASITVHADGTPKPAPIILNFSGWVQPRPFSFARSGGRGETLNHDAYVQAVAQGVWARTAWLSHGADSAVQTIDYFTGYVSAVDALMEGDPSEAAIVTAMALIPGPFDNVGYGLVKTGTSFTKHAAERMAERGISESMVNVALRKGARYWDPKNKTVNYVLKEGFASGKSLLVGRNPVTGEITTVIRGSRVLRPRMVPLP